MSLIDKLHPADTTETAEYMLRRYLRGVDAIAGKKIAIGMIARNAGRTLRQTMECACEVGAAAESCSIYVVTNDNTDDTADVLCDFEPRLSNTSVGWVEHVLHRPYLGGTRETARTVALAEYRNEVRWNLPGDADYVLILDSDLLEISPYRVVAGLGDMVTMCWQAMAAQCLAHLPQFEREWLINYDAFAYRPMWGDRTNYMIERSFHYDVRPSGTRPYRVRSAFGGACWYAGRKFFEDGREYDGEQGCEHVPFHRDLVMGVSPSMSLIGFLG